MTQDALKEGQYLNNEIEILEGKIREARKFLAGDIRYKESLLFRFEDGRDNVLSSPSARYVAGGESHHLAYVQQRADLLLSTNEKILKFAVDLMEADLQILKAMFKEL